MSEILSRARTRVKGQFESSREQSVGREEEGTNGSKLEEVGEISLTPEGSRNERVTWGLGRCVGFEVGGRRGEGGKRVGGSSDPEVLPSRSWCRSCWCENVRVVGCNEAWESILFLSVYPEVRKNRRRRRK